jgi:Fe-S oxidoreductase
MYKWARQAAYAPWLANAVTQTPGLRTLAKAMATMAPERRIPRFAPRTFRSWFKARPVMNAGKPFVILWPDTWNNHFHPDTARAAVEVLEASGHQVLLPSAELCCGRPLYDYGMLDRAKRMLLEILNVLRPHVRNGICIVGLEPSCVSVFRDELVNMLPNDDDAKRLSAQTYLLTEFLAKKARGFTPPTLDAEAVVHSHCHQKSILDLSCEKTILDRTGVRYTMPDTGCCGMTGAFGFEKGEHYRVSIACGERVLLPAVRKSPANTLIVVNGFSCREQIAQTTSRRAIHVADLLKMALNGRSS